MMPGRPSSDGWASSAANAPAPELSVTDVLVPVAVGAQRRLGVVEVQHDEALEAAGLVERLERRVDAGRGAQVVAGLEEVRRVEADADAGVAVDRVDHRRQLVEAHAHRAAGAGRVLEQDAHVGVADLVERGAQRLLDAREAGVEAVAAVRARRGSRSPRSRAARRP